MDDSLSVQAIDNWNDGSSLSSEWNHLVEDSVHPSIYLTFEYLALAWKRFHSDNIQPLILTVRDETNTLIGVAPFGVELMRKGGIRFRVASYVVTIDSDIDKPYIIVKPDCEKKVWRAIIQFLRLDHQSWDLLYLYEMPDKFLGKQLLLDNFNLKSFHREVSEDAADPRLDLTSDWHDFCNFKKEIQEQAEKTRKESPEFLA